MLSFQRLHVYQRSIDFFAFVVDGARYYAIARGSAMECAAHIDCYRKLGGIDDTHYATAFELLEAILAMLTKMCR